VIIHAYNDHVRLLSPELWSSDNRSLLGSRSRHCYAIKWLLVRLLSECPGPYGANQLSEP